MPVPHAAKASANESSAIGSLRAINTAETNFATTCGGGAYDVNLPLLVADDYLSPDMGFNPKSGYNFALQAGDGAAAGPTDCAGGGDGDGVLRDRAARLVPTSGRRAFATGAAGRSGRTRRACPRPSPSRRLARSRPSSS